MHTCMASFMLIPSGFWNVPFYSAVENADLDTFHLRDLVIWFATYPNFCRFVFLWCGL